MKTTIHVYSEESKGTERKVATIKEAMRIASYTMESVRHSTTVRSCPLCIDIKTTIGNKTYQYIQVLDGSTLFVASLKSVCKKY